jgi:prepilin-type processing-associated H-X9-DG protein
MAVVMYTTEWNGFLPASEDWEGALMPYLRNPALFVCPKTRAKYEFNVHLSGTDLDAIENPFEVVCVWDAGAMTKGARPAHGSGFNFGYADGHAKWTTAGGDFGTMTPELGVQWIGQVPPEISAEDWLNAETPPSLAALRGRVVVVAFWTCHVGTVTGAIRDLDEIHGTYGPRGVVVIGLTQEDRQEVEQFMQDAPIAHSIGVRSVSRRAYGVRGIPHAFVIGKDGRAVWDGHPGSREIEAQIRAAL